ncbi:MAG: hypothetical protein U9Q81_15350 [Pseudomonadota bacterium]|nr:hypothetical protein [Pseudomonadota bacterium]
MSKVGSRSSPSARARSGRSYWVRGALSPSQVGDNPPSPKTSGGKRFVEPYRLSEEQRAAVLTPLEGEGIGDPASRELFAAALEYDLGTWRQIVEPEPKPKRPKVRPASNKADEALAELSKAAQILAEQLDRLDDGSTKQLQQGLKGTDRFKRSYGEDYLRSLRCELLRVAGAGQPTRQQAEAPPSRPAISDSARDFLLRAAHVFGECFEITATAEPGAPFLTAIRAIVAATDVEVPTDRRTVSLILKQA